MCDEMGRTAFDYARDNLETMQLLEYIKSYRKKSNSNERDSKAQNLLELYDKTTFDDFIDFDLLITLIGCIHKVRQPGSILVFVPGYDDIMMCNDRIMTSTIDSTSIRVFFLHSSMNIRDQHEVFKKIPNKRKIILSTNIAETSLTIDDVVFVIDTGKCKEKCFDSVSRLQSMRKWSQFNFFESTMMIFSKVLARVISFHYFNIRKLFSIIFFLYFKHDSILQCCIYWYLYHL